MEIDKITIDKYGSLIIPTPKLKDLKLQLKTARPFSLSFVYPNDNILMSKFKNDRKSIYVMRHLYFIYNCKKNKDGSTTLNLNGKHLFCRIRRRLQNWDIPYLALFLSKIKYITVLNLVNNEINSPGFISLIDCIIEHKQIIELDLRNNNVDDIGINYLFNNQSKVQLQVLRLGGNKFGVENSKKLSILLLKNPHILHLDVSDNHQDERSLSYFTTVLRSNQEYFNNTLKILDLSRPVPMNCYFKFDSSHVAMCLGCMLRYNASLEELYIQKFGFCCHDIEEMLENAQYNETLRILDLSCNNIGDYSAEIFGKWLEKRPPLRSLLLAHNIITDNGIKSISRGLHLSKLVTIDVSFNRFTDLSGIELCNSLKKSPLLKELRVFGNDIGHPMAKIIDLYLAADILDQENIDVKPYEVDGVFYFAYYHKKKAN